MLFKTHLLFALFVSLLLMKFFDFGILFLLFVLIGSLIPDIDNVESFLGRKYRIISGPVEFIFGHRGLLHSIYPVLGLVILYFIFKTKLVFALAIGYFLHLVLDAVTKEGITFFTVPFRFKVRGFIKTGGIWEKVLLAVLVIANFVLIYNLYF